MPCQGSKAVLHLHLYHRWGWLGSYPSQTPGCARRACLRPRDGLRWHESRGPRGQFTPWFPSLAACL